MLKYHAYVLIGQDRVGKTSIQRRIWSRLCTPGSHKKLHADSKYQMRNGSRCGPETIFFSESSIQEKGRPAKYIDYYYKEVFQSNSAICMLSSHADGDCEHQVDYLIRLLKTDCYNVCGIFLSNSWGSDERRIASLQWNETLWVKNDHLEGSLGQIRGQLNAVGDQLAELIGRRAADPLA